MTTPASTKRRRGVVAASVAAALVLGLAVVVLLVALGGEDAGPLDEATAHVADVELQVAGACSYEPERGGLVAQFDVRTSDEGRFTVDLHAVTEEGVDDLDVASPHVVRVSVPFYGGQTEKRFDVVVPVSESDYEDGYRECRYVVNPTGA